MGANAGANRMLRYLRILLLAVFSALVAARVASAECTIGKVAELAVTMHGMQPAVDAKVNGVDVRMLLDSGSFYSMISPSTARALKLKIDPAIGTLTVVGIGGDAWVGFAKVDTFTLGPLPIRNIPFLIAGPGGAVDGLLGQNILGMADVEYDLANGVVRLMHPHDCASAMLAYWSGGRDVSTVAIKALESKDPHTLSEATLNGVKIRVMLDTGAETSFVTLEAAERAGVTPQTVGARAGGLSRGLGRHSVQSWIAPFSSFQLGNEEIRNTEIRIGAGGIEHADMLLGADFFRSHHIYVSNIQRRLYFTYNGGPVFDLSKGTSTSDASDAKPANALAPALAR
jgi:predicted aspartyl protease